MQAGAQGRRGDGGVDPAAGSLRDAAISAALSAKVFRDAVAKGGALTLTQKTEGQPVFDLLQVNRLTGRTRFIEP